LQTIFKWTLGETLTARMIPKYVILLNLTTSLLFGEYVCIVHGFIYGYYSY